MSDGKPPIVILASASPRRQELLTQIGLEFKVIPSSFDEKTVIPWPPAEHVMESATGKASDVASRIEDGIVIGADTVVVVDDSILGKPKDMDDAARMLRLLSGRDHFVYTGLCVISKEGNVETARVTSFEKTEVRFGHLDEGVIAAYVRTREPLDKAGAYGIQEKGSVLVESINGDYFNVVGLPVYRLSRMLDELGIHMFGEVTNGKS